MPVIRDRDVPGCGTIIVSWNEPSLELPGKTIHPCAELIDGAILSARATRVLRNVAFTHPSQITLKELRRTAGCGTVTANQIMDWIGRGCPSYHWVDGEYVMTVLDLLKE